MKNSISETTTNDTAMSEYTILKYLELQCLHKACESAQNTGSHQLD